MKKILLKICTILAFVLVPSAIYAADLDITCHEDVKPTITLNTSPLFQLTGFTPGDSAVRTVKVVNADPNNPCKVFLQGDGNSNALTNKIAMTIDSLYTSSLSTFIQGQSVEIAYLQPNQTVEHTITLKLPEDTSNELANKSTNFSIKIVSQWGNSEEEVLAENTENNPSTGGDEENTTPTETSEDVLGTEVNDSTCTTQKLWWLPIAVQLLFTIIIIATNKGLLESPIFKLALTIIIGVLAYVIERKIGCDCVSTKICGYLWVGNTVVSVGPLPQLLLRYIKR